MLQSDFEMNYDNLLLILQYLKRFDKILLFLNKNSKIIIDTLEKKIKNKEDEEDEEQDEEEGEKESEKNNKINLIKIITIKEDDDINIISEEVNNPLEKENPTNHIDIGQDFLGRIFRIF